MNNECDSGNVGIVFGETTFDLWSGLLCVRENNGYSSYNGLGYMSVYYPTPDHRTRHMSAPQPGMSGAAPACMSTCLSRMTAPECYT